MRDKLYLTKLQQIKLKGQQDQTTLRYLTEKGNKAQHDIEQIHNKMHTLKVNKILKCK